MKLWTLPLTANIAVIGAGCGSEYAHSYSFRRLNIYLDRVTHPLEHSDQDTL